MKVVSLARRTNMLEAFSQTPICTMEEVEEQADLDFGIDMDDDDAERKRIHARALQQKAQIIFLSAFQDKSPRKGC